MPAGDAGGGRWGSSLEVWTSADGLTWKPVAVFEALGISHTAKQITAITIGGGGTSSGAHSLNESFDATDSWRGTVRAVLLAVALAR